MLQIWNPLVNSILGKILEFDLLNDQRKFFANLVLKIWKEFSVSRTVIRMMKYVAIKFTSYHFKTCDPLVH